MNHRRGLHLHATISEDRADDFSIQDCLLRMNVALDGPTPGHEDLVLCLDGPHHCPLDSDRAAAAQRPVYPEVAGDDRHRLLIGAFSA